MASLNPVPQSSNKVRTLAVDDDRTMRMLLQMQLEELGHDVITASDGKEAWSTIQKEKDHLDIVVIDREMPQMNGLEVVALMKNDPSLKHIPVIMQTGYDSADQIREGIDAGVFYYLTKPIDEDVLSSVLTAAERETSQQKTLNEELAHHKASFNLICNCKFEFSTLAEAEGLASFLANCFPEPLRVATGLAALLTNAVEHGNLEIGYDRKSELIRNNTWRKNIEQLLKKPENKDKIVEVQFRKNSEGYHVKILDCGKGFAWSRFLQIDPTRATDNHGRGIAQASAISFDRIQYNEVGNEVSVFVSNEAELDW